MPQRPDHPSHPSPVQHTPAVRRLLTSAVRVVRVEPPPAPKPQRLRKLETPSRQRPAAVEGRRVGRRRAYRGIIAVSAARVARHDGRGGGATARRGGGDEQVPGAGHVQKVLQRASERSLASAGSVGGAPQFDPDPIRRYEARAAAVVGAPAAAVAPRPVHRVEHGKRRRRRQWWDRHGIRGCWLRLLRCCVHGRLRGKRCVPRRPGPFAGSRRRAKIAEGRQWRYGTASRGFGAEG